MPCGVPWQCHATALAEPWDFSWRCHRTAMPRATAVPQQCHGIAMALPWHVPWHCRGIAMTAPCPASAIVLHTSATGVRGARCIPAPPGLPGGGKIHTGTAVEGKWGIGVLGCGGGPRWGYPPEKEIAFSECVTVSRIRLHAFFLLGSFWVCVLQKWQSLGCKQGLQKTVEYRNHVFYWGFID